ncbi:MAG: DUF447 domain-containing protein [Gemmataceae bacterium]
MVFEGLVSTVDPEGGRHVAPMGPRFESGESDPIFELAPFQGSSTLKNLLAHPHGVFHVTDQVLMFAQALLGQVQPDWVPAKKIRGWVIGSACRALEFTVVAVDLLGQRSRLTCRVDCRHHFREMGPFNRARHAVVEGAILASRRHLLPAAELERQMEALAPLVEKTGGPDEKLAFGLLFEHINQSVKSLPVDRA